MKKNVGIVLTLLILISCKNRIPENQVKTEIQEIKKENYELSTQTEIIKKVLILFGGFPEMPEDIKREFNIKELAKEHNVAIIYMNYNQKLWLEETEKHKLAALLQSIFMEHKLPIRDTYIGGFSSGGNVALLIGAFLKENERYGLTPKGIFIVDSPIDLVALYKSSEKNIERHFSDVSVAESTWIIEVLGKHFGNPTNDISKYEQYAVYTSQTGNISNLITLKNTKIRLYTEPDTVWWKENRQADFDQMNACFIEKLSINLKNKGFKHVEYIPTQNKGYRANGERHPHSWSIVDKVELIKWMTE